MELSAALKRFRKEFKITQKQAAIAANVSDRNYQDYEYGKVVPSATVLIALADYFDVSIDYLVGRTDSPELVIRSAPAGDEYEIDKDAPPLSPDEIARLRRFLLDSNPGTGK